MSAGEEKAFQFSVRASTRAIEGADAATDTEARDQQLEQYLWTPYQHVSLVYRTTNQALTVAGNNFIVFNATEHDPEAMHSMTVNPTRMTTYIDGIWEFTAHIILLIGAAAAGSYYMNLIKTDTLGVVTAYSMDGGTYLAGDAPIVTASRMVPMKAGDYVEIAIATGAFTNALAIDAGGTFGSPTLQAKYITSVKESGLQTTD